MKMRRQIGGFTLRDQRGFTLVELVIVIIVAAILAAVINIGLGSLSSNKVNSAARRLASDLRFAQQLSLTKHNRHGIIFTAGSYSVFQNDNTGDIVPRNPSGGSPFTVSMTGDLAGVAIATTLTNDVVRFETNGKPLEGTVPAPLGAATRRMTFTDTASGSSKFVDMVRETGALQ